MNHQENGAVGVEYALIIALVSVATVAAAVVLGAKFVVYCTGIDLGLS